MKYRKKPIEIEAVQFDGLNPTEIKDFVGENCDVEIYDNQVTPPVARIVIHTLEGDMEASKGDYVIKGVKGESYPCKPDIFQQTYESEEPDKSLEEEIKTWIPAHISVRTDETLSANPTELADVCKEWGKCVARHFAEWGAEHLRDSTKMIDKSLEEAAYKYSFESRPSVCGQVDVIDAFKAGAEWQARQLLQGSPMPEDTVLFQKGVEEGKRLMMEDAYVESLIVEDGRIDLEGDPLP